MLSEDGLDRPYRDICYMAVGSLELAGSTLTGVFVIVLCAAEHCCEHPERCVCVLSGALIGAP